MENQTIEVVLSECAAFKGLAPSSLKYLADCASRLSFAPDAFIFREGEKANRFYLIEEGMVSLELSVAGRGVMTIQTLKKGDLLGWSWFDAPYQWHFDAKALEPTRAIAFDAAAIRARCEEDHAFGYEILKRFVHVMAERLQAARLQLLDVYKPHTL